jgi:hypothetical protein
MKDISRHKAEVHVKQLELRVLLNEWDPIGIGSTENGPRDECDCFFWLIEALHQGRPPSALARRLRTQLADHFGVDPDISDPEGFAERVYAWYWSDPIPDGAHRRSGSGFIDPRDALVHSYEDAVNHLREEMGTPRNFVERWRFSRARRRLWAELVDAPLRTAKW